LEWGESRLGILGLSPMFAGEEKRRTWHTARNEILKYNSGKIVKPVLKPFIENG